MKKLETKTYPRARTWLGRLDLAVLLLTVALGHQAAFAASPLDDARDASSHACLRVSLERPLLWTTSGVWANGELLVADAFKESILRVGLDGAQGSAGAIGAARPSQIRGRPGYGLIVEDKEAGMLIHVDENLSVIDKEVQVKGRSLGGSRLSAIYDWVPMGNGFLAFSDLQQGDDWTSAFIYFDDQGGSRSFSEIAVADPARLPFLRNGTYLASLGDLGYILRLDPPVRLIEVGAELPNGRLLDAIPADLAYPMLSSKPRVAGPQRATQDYQRLEESHAVTGLFAWRDLLYVVIKEPKDEQGKTAWSLSQLNPLNGQELARLRLPTSHAHLTIVPGDQWALIEKDPVQSVGEFNAPYMTTTSMVLVPGEWIEDPAHSPLSEFGKRVFCEPAKRN